MDTIFGQTKGFLGICAKACQRNRCKDKCKGWFPSDIQLREGCQGACTNDYKKLKAINDYLCGGYVSEQEVILSRGYDPCPGGLTVEDVLKPWDLETEVDEKAKAEQTSDTRTLLIWIAAGLLLMLGLFVLLKE